MRITHSILALVFAFVIVPFNLKAQSEKIEVLTADGFNRYTYSPSEWLVRFEPGISDAMKEKALEQLPYLRTFEHYPSPEVSIIRVAPGVSSYSIERDLEQIGSVRYVARGLIYEDGTPEFPLDRVFIQTRSNEDLLKLEELIEKQGAAMLGESFMPGLYEVEFSKNSRLSPIAWANMLNRERHFDWVEVDMMKFLKKLSTNDPLLANQWSLNNTGSSVQYNGIPGEDMSVFNAWTLNTGSPNIKVAILDEGVDLDHPDLQANILPGFDGHGLTAGDAINDDAHGTACAGIVAAVANNNIGTAGVAYGSKIIPVRIAYSNSSGSWVTSSSIIGNCITWSWQTAGADVLSNSWGGGSTSSLVSTPIANSVTQGRSGLGAPVLFAAGNGNGSIGFPASLDDVISVAAMSMCAERKNPSSCDGESWWGSDYGVGLDVAAPGVKIAASDIAGSSGYSSGDYTLTFNGTSSACPNAAGVMALVLSANPGLTENQARFILESTCDKAGSYTYSTVAGYPNGTRSNDLGYGRVNAYSAVQAALGSASNCPFSGQLGVFGINIGQASVYIANSSATSPNYIVEYGPSGFLPGTGTQITTTNDTTVLTGLSAQTTYAFYYYLICGADTSFALSGPNFTTPCGSYTAPYFQDFSSLSLGWNNDYGQCWTSPSGSANPRWEVEDSEGANENSMNTGPWFDNTSPSTAGGQYFFLETSSPSGLGDTAILLSPFIDLSGLNTPQLSFYYHMYGGDMGNLHVDIYDGTAWQRGLVTISGEQQTSGNDAWIEQVISLSPFTGTIQVRFRGEAGISFESDMSIDDIRIDEAPLCPSPGSPSVSNVQSNSATISWIPGNAAATSWTVEYGLSGFSPGSGTSIQTSNPSLVISGLSANTTYDFYITEACVTVSGNSNAISGNFTTATCNISSQCIYTVTMTDSYGDGWNGNVLGIRQNGLIVATFGAGFTSGSSFGPVNISLCDNQLSEIVVVNLGSYTSEVGFTISDPTGNVVHSRSSGLTFSSGTIFHTFSTDCSASFCPPALNLQVSNVSSTTADLNWTAGPGSTGSWVIEYGSPGFSLGTGTFLSTINNPVVLSSLSTSTDYEVVVYEICAGGDTSAASNRASFQTACGMFGLPYTEDFSNAIIGSLLDFGNCWTTSSTTIPRWESEDASTVNENSIGTGPIYDNTSFGNAGGVYMYLECSGGFQGQSNMLNSPSINISGVTYPEVSFYYHMYGAAMGTLELEISYDGGNTWSTIWTLSGEQQISGTSPWIQAIVPFSNLSSTVYFRFVGIRGSSYTSDMSIDDFSVYAGSNCPVPVMATVSSITSNQATLSWSSTAAAFDVELGTAGFTPSGTPTHTSNVASLVVSGLASNTAYEYYVRSNCGASTSNWIGPIGFTTTISCPAPSNLNVTSTNSSATLSWTSGGSSHANYAVVPSGGLPSAASIMSVSNATIVNVQGLNPLTNYTAFVRDSCAQGDVSAWQQFNFTTSACDTVSQCTYSVYMTDTYGDGWNGNVMGLRQNGIVVATFGSGFTSGSTYGPVPISLCGGLSTEVFVSNLGGWSPEVGFVISDPFGNTVFTHSPGSTLTSGMLLGMFSSNCSAPSCSPPSALSVGTITVNTVDLSWTAGSSSASSWVVEIGPSGFFPGMGNMVLANTNPATIAGLNSSTSYSAFVYEICPNGDTSMFSNRVDFTTPCSFYTAPYQEDFSSATLGYQSNFGNCWTTDGGSVNPRWEAEDAEGVNENSVDTGPWYDNTSFGAVGGKYMYMETSSPSFTGDTARLLSPFIDISGMNAPELSFYYHMYGSTMGNLHVDVWNAGIWNRDVAVILGQQQNSGGDTWLLQTSSLSAFSGLIRVRFRGVAGSSFYGDMSIDDFTIDNAITCFPVVGGVQASNISGNSADLSWAAVTGATAYVVEYGPSGFSQGNGTLLNVNTNTASISGLSAQTPYDVYVRNDCGSSGMSSWMGPSTFTTACPAIQATPYAEDFETTFLGAALDFGNCWTSNTTFGYRWEGEDAEGFNENSLNTGPWYDNTLFGSPGGRYMYAEASSSGSFTQLSSPLIDLSNLSLPELSFYYHMYGQAIGTLDVELSDDNGSSWTSIWSISGQQHSNGAEPWTEAKVDISSYSGAVMIRFVAFYGGSFEGDIAIDDFQIDENPNVNCPTYNPTATDLGTYRFRLRWNGTGVPTYNVHFQKHGQGWKTITANDTSRLIANVPTGPFRFFISEPNGVNAQCDTSSHMMMCENISFNTNVFQINDATGGKVFVNLINGGRRLWDVGIRDSADAQGDTSWTNNKFSVRLRNLSAGTYYIFVRDDYGCISSQVDTVRIIQPDASLQASLNNLVRSGNQLTAHWSVPNPSGVNAYQVRLRDITNGWSNVSLIGSYIVTGGASNTYVMSGLANGRYRVDVRARPVGGSFADGVYSNHMERIINVSSKAVAGAAGNENLPPLVEVYPNPTSASLYVLAPQNSRVELLELSGKVLHIQTSREKETQIDMAPYAKGVYLIRIEHNGNVFMEKVVKD